MHIEKHIKYKGKKQKSKIKKKTEYREFKDLYPELLKYASYQYIESFLPILKRFPIY